MIISIIHIIVSYDQNISLICLCEWWIPWQAWHPSCVYITAHETVHCSTKDVYTSEITFLALRPWYGLDSWYILLINYHKNCVHCTKIPAWTIRLYVLFPVFNGANINTNINILLTYIHNIPTIFLSISFCLFVSEEMGWGGE